jgi:hypothetical protein
MDSIRVKPSPTADTRTCDYANVTEEQLLESSKQHINDVQQALGMFAGLVLEAAQRHDIDKITDIRLFHHDFLTGFKEHTWWDVHRKINRHHLTHPDGIPQDVNLIDVLDYIADCVMSGMARSGEVYPLELPVPLLVRAFENTVLLLKTHVIVDKSE